MIWTIKRSYYRVIHYSMKLILKFLNFNSPELITGAGCIVNLVDKIKKRKIRKPLIVSGKTIIRDGSLNDFFTTLKNEGIEYVVFNDIQPNPTIENVEATRKAYLDNNCDGIVAIGGGSPMDCAKVAAARVTNPKKDVKSMMGLMKISKKLPPFFAVPTTAGTGSEVTVAAVITDLSTHAKYGVSDPKLIPLVAVLDPKLTVGLPPHITSTTGMDALTHAIEAYVGLVGTSYTNKKAENAVKMIFDNLETVYKDGSNLKARNEMLLASFYAGEAFTKAYVGYVHAIAHKMGGLYGVSHGLANAVILPYVLEYFGKSVYKKLANLAVITGIGKKDENKEILAKRFIEKIKNMNKNMNIPSYIKELKEEDIPEIVKTALKEANPVYPVPKIMNEKDCAGVICKMLFDGKKDEKI